jgi:hypothetical protein
MDTRARFLDRGDYFTVVATKKNYKAISVGIDGDKIFIMTDEKEVLVLPWTEKVKKYIR